MTKKIFLFSLKINGKKFGNVGKNAYLCGAILK